MRKCAPFAVSFLSALLALPVLAADVRTAKDPYVIEKAFPPQAKVRVLNLWATWCRPCVAEMADLRAIDEMFGREVAIAGVSFDDMIPDTKPAKVTAFLDKHGITYPNFYYTGNMETIGSYFDFSGEIPITIVYDAEHVERWRHVGPIERDALVAKLNEILGRKR